MERNGGQADADVPGFDVLAPDHLVFFHHAHDGSGDIVIPHLVNRRHLRGFAANQDQPHLHAFIGHSSDDLFHHLHIQLPRREIIQEKEGLGSLHQNVIDGVAHDVRAQTLILFHRHTDLGFSADPIRGGDQDRFLILGRVELEQSAE